jgi:glycosyltransferase involved in cell wall biosynthesis
VKYIPRISVIIPTYNRSKLLIKIVKTLICSNIPNEIIICDSNSKDQTYEKIRNLKLNFKKQIIKYYNINNNSNALKRNIGLKSAKSKYVIFLDDDCIPQKNFLEDYYFILEKHKYKNLVFCGSVIYPMVNKSNLMIYRETRHFKIDRLKKIENKILHPRKIVTMNMGFKKKIITSKKIFFSKKFGNYGFEDYEFGFRLFENKIKLIPSCPLVCHNDYRNFEKYLSKLKFVGFEGSKKLKKINLKAAIENNFIKLENSLLIKSISNFKLCLNILIFIERKMLILEKKVRLPNFLYKFLTINSYLIGFFLFKQDIKINNKFKKWYF